MRKLRLIRGDALAGGASVVKDVGQDSVIFCPVLQKGCADNCTFFDTVKSDGGGEAVYCHYVKAELGELEG